MLYKKGGFPEESEIVLCTVNNIQHHTVFVKLDEYGKTGIVHISEIAPGRVRNIREYVSEGKKIICKVLRVHEERGHIDLSLRRVSEYQRRQKTTQIKQEQLAEKIVEFAAKELKKPFEDVYQQVSENVTKTYPYLYPCFEEVVTEGVNLEKLGMEKKLAAVLEDLIKQRIKPPQVAIEGDLSLSSYRPEGVEDIKQVLSAVPVEGLSLKYLGAGKYRVGLIDKEYKSAEERLAKTLEAVESLAKKNNVTMAFTRIETKK